MDTLKGVVDTASKVFFGDQTAQQHGQTGEHVEPLSGVTGDTSAGEPYDGGNIGEAGPGDVAGGKGYTQEDDAHAFTHAHEIPRQTGMTSGTAGGQGYTQEDDAHAFKTAHEIPRQSGMTSGTAGGEGYTQEDDAHAFKTAHEIPRDNTNTSSGLTGTGSGLTGSSNTGSGLTGTGSGLTGGSSNSGPHDSSAANKLDPRVDSDRDGRSGLTGSSNTGSGLTGTGSGLTGGSSNSGPHDSSAANKLDPRVDSDRDGRSAVSPSNTQYQGGVGEPLSKAASAVTGGAVGGAAAQHGTQHDNRETTGGNNNLNEYSMKDATEHATSGRHGQPGIADASHRADTQGHQGANDPMDEPGHHESHAIRDTKNQAERKLDPANDTPGSHGPESSSGRVGQNPDSVRQGSLTGHLPGVAGGEGLQKTSTGEGTGKEWVKSSGLAAEGGDFDASKPGAGREADRLLDEHGIHHGEKEHVGHGHEEEDSKKVAAGKAAHSGTGTHSHGAHTGTPGTLGAHDQRDVETASTTAIRDGIPGQTPGTHTSTTGASTSQGTHTGAHDTTGTTSGHTTGTHTGTHTATHDEKPSLKEKVKAKLHMH